MSRYGNTEGAAYPGIWQSTLLMFAVSVLGGIFVVPFAVWLALRGRGFMMHPAALAFANSMAFGLVVWYGFRRTRRPAMEVFPLKPVAIPALLAVAVATVGLDILLSEWDNLFRRVLPIPKEVADMLGSLIGGRDSLIWSLILGAVVAPVAEETLFRGVVLSGLERRYKYWTAIAITAVLFGAMHMNPWQLCSASVFGILAGWVRMRSGSLIPCVVAHSVGNGMITMLSRLPFEIQGFNTSAAGPAVFQPWWFDLLGAALLIAGVMAFRAQTRTPSSPAALAL